MADFLASVMRQEADHQFNAAPFDMRAMFDLFSNDSEGNAEGTAFMNRETLLKLINARKKHSIEKRQNKVNSKQR